MLLKDKKVAIVGGGPGGLTLARLLQQEGIDVKVYERDFDKNARVQGSPLDLHDESGLAALGKAGLLDGFKKSFLRGADKKLIVNERAEIFFSDHEIKIEENFGSPYFRPEIDRGALRKLLLDSLQEGTVIWDSHFVSLEREHTGWRLHFRNGASFYADVVIGADGANSKVRPYITDSKAFYSGVTMIEGNIYDAAHTAPGIYKFLNGGKIMAFGNTRGLYMGMKGGGHIGFVASLKTDQNRVITDNLDYADKAQVMEWFKNEFPGWSGVWYELFENAELPFIPRPIYCMPLDQTWEAQANLTILGDAAHVMPPFAGEGVNMAMLDALTLSEYLVSGKFATLKDAISAYEAGMRERAAITAKESLDNGELMHSENALEKMLGFFGNKEGTNS